MKIYQDFDVKDYLTLAASAKVKEFVVLESEEDLQSFFEYCDQEKKYYFLGGGANTLFVDDFDATVVHLAMKGKRILEETDDDVLISVAAGEDWIEFVDWTVEKDYLGLENLVMIPGSVGAAPVQNIGAYGVEVASVVEVVEGVVIPPSPLGNKGGTSIVQTVKLSKKECKFAYRDSVFKCELKGKFIIGNVVFRLKKNLANYSFCVDYKGIQDVLVQKNISLDVATQRELAAVVKELRGSKLPDWKELGTAGSFFKNPIVDKDFFEELQQKYEALVFYPVLDESKIKLSAGQLLDMAGLKNYRQGNVGTYRNHALIIVNYGGASGKEIWSFAQMLQEKVEEMFGVRLEPEVNVV